ncbi:MAG: SDR family NAD(P)-dependent oxidoreductase [Planctomycetota bacterium]|nr:MAG: SDR family NAD(P)-dependent oxidoreductase [Planctomycetota bacterium]
MSRRLLDLGGRHALVCGASSGIGRAAALAMASMGAELTVLARNRGRLDSLLKEMSAAGSPQVRALAVDLEEEESLAKAVDCLLTDHGPIHILINNSGGPPSGPLLAAEAGDFLKALRRHLFASHFLVRALLPGMQEQGYGRIINIISTSVKEPIPGLGVSNTVRGAMASWAKTLSKELPAGVTINNVLPGFTATERLESLKQQMASQREIEPEAVEQGWLSTVPEKRLGLPEELGAAVAFLASPAAAYIRGVSLPVDGGRLNSI